MHVLARQNNWYKLKQKYSKHKDSEEPVRLKACKFSYKRLSQQRDKNRF
jgi:hypothetical protein